MKQLGNSLSSFTLLLVFTFSVQAQGFLQGSFSAQPTSGCPPLTVQFTDQSFSPQDSITSWFWNFGDGNFSSLQHPTHVYFDSSYYSVSLIVCNSTLCDSIFVADFIDASCDSSNSNPGGGGTPVNDDCSTAIQLTCGDAVQGNTDNASGFIPQQCSTSATAPGIWYTFIGTGDEFVISTCSPFTDYDTKLHLYGGSCNGLVCVNGNDDACSLQSEMTVQSVPGDVYYIYVSGFSSASGNFMLSLNCQTPPPIQVDAVGNDIGCGQTSGWAWANANGGVTPYSYQWSNGATTSQISATVAGTYFVTVTDASGGTATDSIVINDYSGTSLTIDSFHVINASCAGNADGSIRVFVSGGNPPYWFWGGGGPNGGGTNTTGFFENLAAGTYFISASDSTQCMDSIAITVQQNSNAIFTIDSVIMPDCNNPTGAIYTSASGGLGPYTYSINGAAAQSAGDFTGLQEGIYEISMTTAAGCTIWQTAFLEFEGFQVDIITGDQQICAGESVNLTAVDPSGTCVYTLEMLDSFGDGWNGASIEVSINGLNNTVYTAQNNGTTITFAVNSGDSIGLFYTAGQFENENSYNLYDPQGNLIFSDGPNPRAGWSFWTAAACSSGTGIASVSWSPSNGLSDATILNPIASPTATTTYVLTATDAAGCTSVDSVTIEVSSALTVDAGDDQDLCGTNIVTLTAATNGGLAPFMYEWERDGSGLGSFTSPVLQATVPGDAVFVVHVIDAAGCIATDTVEVTLDSQCFSELSGTIYHDINGNCSVDSGDIGMANVLVEITDGNVTLFTFTNGQGEYAFLVGTGNWEIVQNVPQYFEQQCPNAPNGYSVPVNSTSTNTGGLDFYNKPIPLIHDLRVDLYHVTTVTPGFPRWTRIYYYNDGQVTMDGTVEYHYDANTIFDYSVPPPTTHDAVNRILTWDFTNLLPGQCEMLRPYFDVPQTATLGDLVYDTAWVYPIPGDFTPANNVVSTIETIVGSWDPNDKAVSPKGEGETGNITIQDFRLSYLVRFQNTGTAEARNIVVRDTLDSDLDLRSFRMGGASHAYNLTIEDDNVLVWSFPGINLPDSNTNEPLSHGHISYSIRQNPNLAIGTEITNSASIYFDFNLPVKTNTVLNTIYEKVVSSVEPIIPAVELQLSPNPAQNFVKVGVETGIEQIQLLNLMGQQVQVQEYEQFNKAVEFDLSSVPSGVYLLKLKSGSKFFTEKLIVKD